MKKISLFLLGLAMLWMPTLYAQKVSTLSLNNGLSFTFHQSGEFFLGLERVEMAGEALKSQNHLSLPLLCNEWGEHQWLTAFYKLKAVENTPTGYSLTLEVMASESSELWRHFFALAPDSSQIRPETLRQLQQIEAQLEVELKKNVPKYAQSRRILDSLQRLAPLADFRKQERIKGRKKRERRRLVKLKSAYLQTLRGELAERYQRIQAQIVAETADSEFVLRDAHRLAMPEVAAYSIAADTLKALLLRHQNELTPIGTLTWQISQTEAPAWQGLQAIAWKQQFEVALLERYQSNAFRMLNTWELGGTTDALTAINLKYRGFGHVEQLLGVGESFCTSDIWPAPYAKIRAKVWKQGYGHDPARRRDLNQRLDANLLLMARGAGTSFFDMQVKGQRALFAYPERQDNWRAITETYPGDACLSHIDEFRFGQTHRFQVPAMHYVVYQAPANLEPYQYRTLWAFMDKQLRQQVSEELGFRHSPAMPCVGMNWDIFSTKKSNARCALNLAAIAPELAAQGVKVAISHTSGWINGQGVRLGLDGQDTTHYLGSGSCNVYDWKPMPQLEEAWPIMYDSLQRHGIGYIPWITAMSKAEAPFAMQVSADRQDWALNSPDGLPNDIYEADMVKYNVHNEQMLALLESRIFENKRRYGFEGLWYDSFHNLWMSFLDWGSGSGAPMQRRWWEKLSEWSQQGVALVSENQAFPGLNCSIESPGWEQAPYYLGHTLKWLRNGEHKHYSAEQLDTLGFKLLACGGWLTFDILEYSTDGPYQLPNEIMPHFADWAKAWEKLQELESPDLIFLKEDIGTLWIDYKTGKGLLFLWESSEAWSGYAAFNVHELSPSQVQHFQQKDLLGWMSIKK